jgi:N-acetylneuraminic acid mutarotase
VETYGAPNEAPSPRVGSASAVANGEMYLFSGRGGVAMAPVEEHGALWSYNPSHPRWRCIKPTDALSPYPSARSYHAMTADGDETLYVHAGCPESGRLADLWAFNITSETWLERASAPGPPRGGTSIAFCSGTGKLYRINGFDGKTEQGGNLDVYDPSTNTWSTKTYRADGVSGPEPRSVGVLLAVTINAKDYLVTMFGEGQPSSLGHAGAGKMFSDIWAFDLESDTWQRVESDGLAPDPRGWFGADVVAADQSIVLHGGLAENNSRLGDVWKLRLY